MAVAAAQHILVGRSPALHAVDWRKMTSVLDELKRHDFIPIIPQKHVYHKFTYEFTS
jgi:hypothetical protein